jgi:hypothetical protein
LGKIRSFIDKSLNKRKKKENFCWSFLFLFFYEKEALYGRI